MTWTSPTCCAADVAEEPTPAPAAPDAPIEGRGRTVIADRVLERLAARIALEVPGVFRHSRGPDVLAPLTASLPRADAEAAGERVLLGLQLAVAWDVAALDVAAQVRSRVRDRLSQVTGKLVDRVDVTIDVLLTPSQQAGALGQGRVQ